MHQVFKKWHTVLRFDEELLVGVQLPLRNGDLPDSPPPGLDLLDDTVDVLEVFDAVLLGHHHPGNLHVLTGQQWALTPRLSPQDPLRPVQSLQQVTELEQLVLR